MRINIFHNARDDKYILELYIIFKILFISLNII